MITLDPKKSPEIAKRAKQLLLLNIQKNVPLQTLFLSNVDELVRYSKDPQIKSLLFRVQLKTDNEKLLKSILMFSITKLKPKLLKHQHIRSYKSFILQNTNGVYKDPMTSLDVYRRQLNVQFANKIKSFALEDMDRSFTSSSSDERIEGQVIFMHIWLG
jgi:hypothetical protein